MDRESLAEWAKDKPLSILQLDPADRAVLRIAGECQRCSPPNNDGIVATKLAYFEFTAIHDGAKARLLCRLFLL